jgi:hypothetical protein
MATESHFICRNCNTSSTGTYCLQCGQYHTPGRITFQLLWKEFTERYLNFDRGIWLTFREMWTDPGGVAVRYVYGKRRSYINPVSYLLVCASISYGVYIATEPVYISETIVYLERQIEGDPAMAENLERIFGEDDPAGSYSRYTYQTMRGMHTYMVFLLGLLFAVSARFISIGSNYTLAETTILAFYIAGHVSLINAAVTPLAIKAGITISTIVTIVLYCGYAGFGARGFFGTRVTDMVLGAVAMLIAYAVYVFVIILAIIALIIYNAV